MKRTMALIMAIMMVMMAMVIQPVSAAGTPTFSVTSGTGCPGDVITVTVNVEGNPGITALSILVGYDSEKLTLSAYRSGTEEGLSFDGLSFGPPDGNPFSIIWEDTLKPNNTTNGGLVELDFEIKAGAEAGDTQITVEYDPEEVFDEEYNNVTFATKAGTITITEKIEPVTGVEIDESLSILVGETATPKWTISPEEASNRNVTFTTSDATVASVDETTGAVTGKKEGTATITIKTADGGFTDTCLVTVACGHENKTATEAKKPTCTEGGWDAYEQCDACGKYFDAAGKELDGIPTLAALGHSMKETEAKEATCTESGNKAYYTCDTCKGVYADAAGKEETTPEAMVIPAKGHKEGEAKQENVIPATCVKAGSCEEVVYCTECGEELSRENKELPIDKDAHDWGEWKTTKEATCLEAGEKERVCLNDETHTEQGTVEKLSHKMTYVAGKAATCTETGTREYYSCESCGLLYSDANGTTEIKPEELVIAATGHTAAAAVKENEKAATCEGDGSYDEVVYCSTCHVELSREHKTVAATGHKAGAAKRENEKAATCAKEGSYDEVQYCTVCHKQLKKTAKKIPIDADAHAWGEWTESKAATDTEPGEEKRVCANDPTHEETREIAALGHVMTYVEAKEPTETKEGNKAYYICTRCDRWYEDEDGEKEITDKTSVIIPATGSQSPTTGLGDTIEFLIVLTTLLLVCTAGALIAVSKRKLSY